MSALPINILFAGGGTGGHLFPGIAIAQKFIEKNKASNILFVGSGNEFEKAILSENKFNHKKITTAGIKGLGLFKKINSALKIPKGMIESSIIIKNFKPDIIIGVGGYSSGPLIIMAWLMRIFTGKYYIALQEQNILPGITNRILSKFSDKIFISFEKTSNYFKTSKTMYTGNPVRKEILKIAEKKVHKQENKNVFTILIIGGSQGAHSINMAIIESLKRIKQTDKYFFIHQTGEKDIEIVKKSYTDLNINCEVKPFFNDIDRQYEMADLIVCRAGATTIAEITAMGIAALLIPFPYAADNHQVLNAETLVEKEAAEMILEESLQENFLANKIESYMENRLKIEQMARNSKKIGKPDAADVIVENCYKMMESRN